MSAGVIVLGLSWLAIAAAVLVLGSAFFMRLLGQEECLPRGSFGPWLFLAGALSLLVAWWLRAWGATSLPLVFSTPILAAALWSIRLRFAEREARLKSFAWLDAHLVRTADGSGLVPTFARRTGAYLCTGPASGYCLYTLELFDDDGSIGRNGYVSEVAVRRDVERLARMGCTLLDAQLVWQSAPTVLYSCHLGPWAHLLCGQLHTLPQGSERFWRQWLRPRFPAEGSAEVATTELRTHVAPLLEAEPEEGARLVAFLAKAGPKVRIMTERALKSLEDGIRGKHGQSTLQFEGGVAMVTLRPGPPSS